MDPIDNFKEMLGERLSAFPDNRYYLAAAVQLKTIETEYRANGSISKETYKKQTLGVMCAKEVEPIDMPFCDSAYTMLEYVRETAR